MRDLICRLLQEECSRRYIVINSPDMYQNEAIKLIARQMGAELMLCSAADVLAETSFEENEALLNMALDGKKLARPEPPKKNRKPFYEKFVKKHRK